MWSRESWAAAVVAALVVAGCAGAAHRETARQGTARQETAQRGTAQRGTKSAPSDAATLGPADGKWLTDAAGNAYYLEKVAKSQAHRQADGSVRNNWGIPLQVEREDEQFFHYKVYRAPASATAMTAPVAHEPTKAERAQIAASYAVNVREESRLGFTPFGSGLPTRGQWRQGFAIADMNGDGHPDIVHGAPRKRPGPPIVFLGDGAGQWRPWQETRFPSGSYDYGDAAVGDFDGDGKPDVALGMHLLGMAALRNEGGGKFSDAGRGLDRPGKDGAPAAFSSRALTVVDWDRDGRSDILALGEGPRVMGGQASTGGSNGLVLYRGNGDGTWRRYDQGTSGRRAFGPSLAVGDFDYDGRLDAATASSTLGLDEIVHFGNASGGWDSVALAGLRPASFVRAVAVDDLDGDGRDDLVLSYASFEAATWRNGIDVLLARPGRTWQRVAIASGENRVGIHALATGDLDGDRARDVVALTESGETWVFRGDGRGGFTRERETPAAYPGGCRGVHVAIADLDGDRTGEIVAAFADERDAAPGDEPRCPSGGGITASKVSVR